MSPKKQITDYAEPNTSKTPKKAQEVPSADDGFFLRMRLGLLAHNNRPRVTSTICTVPCSMRGQKHANIKPLETYRAMKSGTDKHNFWRNYLADKKFTWLSVQESHTCSSSATEGHIQGWLSKYRVAAEEKLLADSELLQQLLDLLP